MRAVLAAAALTASLPLLAAPVPFPRQPKGTRSHLERLITADEKLAWNGTGQMTAAFTTRSGDPGWKKAIKQRAAVILKRAGRRPDADGEAAVVERAEKELRAERMGERDAVVAWLRAGAPKEAYEANRFQLPPVLAGRPITRDYEGKDEAGKFAKIKSILDARCGRCHTRVENGGDVRAGMFPLDDFAALKKFLRVAGE